MNQIPTLLPGNYEQTIVVTKSRFIAVAQSVATVAAAQAWVQAQRKTYPAATHYCYAYVVDGAVKCSDDGEPAGTAGQPILQAIQAQQLQDVVVVVVRYFGGTKLGTGGLARAYGQAATAVLAAAPRATKQLCRRLTVTGSYAQADLIAQVAARFGQIQHKTFTDAVSYTVAVPVDQVTAFVQALQDEGRGTITVDGHDEMVLFI